MKKGPDKCLERISISDGWRGIMSRLVDMIDRENIISGKVYWQTRWEIYQNLFNVCNVTKAVARERSRLKTFPCLCQLKSQLLEDGDGIRYERHGCMGGR